MKSKYYSAAAICLALVSAANAQSTTTLYGLIDAGFEHVDNIGAAKASVTRQTNVTGTFGSRLGFRGVEDLGGGLKGVFNLEMGFDPGSGAPGQGGRAFGRVATVGVAGP